MTAPSALAQDAPHMQALKALFTAHERWFSGQDDFDAIVAMNEALVRTQAQELAVESLKTDAASAAMIQDRYIAPPYDLEALLECPEDSLGYVYASHMKQVGFDPDLYSDVEIDSDASYVEARLGQTHDIWHAITGFGTSTIEEIGLQAFHLAQFPYPLATMLIANVLVTTTLLKPEESPLLIATIKRGWQMGQRSKPLFPQKWEQAWDKSLSQWRTELNIQSSTSETVWDKKAQPIQTNLTTRYGTIADIPFLARIEYEASLPPLNRCFWEDLLEGTDTSALPFIEAMLKAEASNWGDVSDFLILEEEGKPVAAAAGFTPGEDYRPLCLSRLEAMAPILGWSAATTAIFRDRYEAAFGYDPQPDFLKPQAPWIIETVAVLPEARGRGLGKTLLRALLEEGRSRHHSHAGIMVLNGNDAARHTYESVGFKPYQSFHAEYFDFEFTGVTKFRLCLNSATEKE